MQSSLGSAHGSSDLLSNGAAPVLRPEVRAVLPARAVCCSTSTLRRQAPK